MEGTVASLSVANAQIWLSTTRCGAVQGWSDKFNSWEPKEHLNCEELIVKYNEQKKQAEESGYELDKNGQPMVGFDYDHKLAAMLGARFEDDNIFILCRWFVFAHCVALRCADRGCDFALDREGVPVHTFVPAAVIRQRCPNQLLDFYESRIRIGDVDSRQKNHVDAEEEEQLQTGESVCAETLVDTVYSIGEIVARCTVGRCERRRELDAQKTTINALKFTSW